MTINFEILGLGNLFKQANSQVPEPQNASQ
jgi:hypothetical protein